MALQRNSVKQLIELADAIDAALAADLRVSVPAISLIVDDPMDTEPLDESMLSPEHRQSLAREKAETKKAQAIARRLKEAFAKARLDLSENEVVRFETDVEEFRVQLAMPYEPRPLPRTLGAEKRMAALSKRLRFRADAARGDCEKDGVVMAPKLPTITFANSFATIRYPFSNGKPLELRASPKANALQVLFRNWKKKETAWLDWPVVAKAAGIQNTDQDPYRFFEDRKQRRPEIKQVFHEIIERKKLLTQTGTVYKVRLSNSYSYISRI